MIISFWSLKRQLWVNVYYNECKNIENIITSFKAITKIWLFLLTSNYVKRHFSFDFQLKWNEKLMSLLFDIPHWPPLDKLFSSSPNPKPLCKNFSPTLLKVKKKDAEEIEDGKKARNWGLITASGFSPIPWIIER